MDDGGKLTIMDDQITCRICLEDELDRNDVIAPCSCSGGSKWVHRESLDMWRTTKQDRAFSRCTECLQDFRLIPIHEDDDEDAAKRRKWKYWLHTPSDSPAGSPSPPACTIIGALGSGTSLVEETCPLWSVCWSSARYIGDRRRLEHVNEKLMKQSETLERCHNIVNETEAVGVDILNELGENREKLAEVKDKSKEIDGMLDDASTRMKRMQRREDMGGCSLS